MSGGSDELEFMLYGEGALYGLKSQERVRGQVREKRVSRRGLQEQFAR